MPLYESCPACDSFEKENASLRVALGTSRVQLVEENVALLVEVVRLREAVRWILDRHDSGVMHREHDMNELRKRAGEEK